MIRKKLAALALLPLLLLTACAASEEREPAAPVTPPTPEQQYESARHDESLVGVNDSVLSNYRGAALAGHYWATRRLYEIYRQGIGVSVDEAEALKWLTLAAEGGSLQAYYELGAMHHFGNGTPKDSRAAAECWRIAGEGGHAAAMSNLGSLYFAGDGVALDVAEAVRWFRNSAERGDAVGQRKLALLLTHGLGVEPDPVESTRWMRSAAEQDDLLAMESMVSRADHGFGMELDRIEAAVWAWRAKQAGSAEAGGWFAGIDQDLRAAAARGELVGYRYLGLANSEGLGGTFDRRAAFEMYELAGRLDDPLALLETARLRASGVGVEQDEAGAVADCRRAAELGNASAQFEYGLLCEHGRAKGEHAEALVWFERAAAQDHAEARAMLALEPLRARAIAGERAAVLELGAAFEDGLGVRSDEESALYWYARAGEDDAEALYRIGQLHLKDIGRTNLLGARHHPRSPAEAKPYLRKAADAGHTPACVALATLFASWNPSSQDFEFATHYANLAAAGGDDSALRFVRARLAERDERLAAEDARERERLADQERWALQAELATPRASDVYTPSPCGFCNGSGLLIASRGYYLNGNYWPETTTTCLECNGTGLLFH